MVAKEISGEVAPVILKLERFLHKGENNMITKQRSELEWSSIPFLIDEKGYKMFLKFTVLNDTYYSVALHLMGGPMIINSVGH